MKALTSKYINGFAHFDFDDIKFKAIEDNTQHWNGWSMPYIHEDDVKKLCEFLSLGFDDFGELYTYDDKNRQVVFTSTESEDYKQTIEATTFEGEIYYNFGFFGLTFEFKNGKA